VCVCVWCDVADILLRAEVGGLPEGCSWFFWCPDVSFDVAGVAFGQSEMWLGWWLRPSLLYRAVWHPDWWLSGGGRLVVPCFGPWSWMGSAEDVVATVVTLTSSSGPRSSFRPAAVTLLGDVDAASHLADIHTNVQCTHICRSCVQASINTV